MPIHGLFAGRRDPIHTAFAVMFTHDLKAERQPFGRESAGHHQRRYTDTGVRLQTQVPGKRPSAALVGPNDRYPKRRRL